MSDSWGIPELRPDRLSSLVLSSTYAGGTVVDPADTLVIFRTASLSKARGCVVGFYDSYQRRSRGKRLRDFQLRRQEKFLYICNTLDLWEWEIRVLDIQDGNADERNPECLDGRGAAPPESCGGPRGYRLMLARQEVRPQLSDPETIAASMKVLAQVYRDEPAIDWPFFAEVVTTGWKSVEERLARSGPLTPTRFCRREATGRLASLMQQRRWWR
jgi:hypothetical protein